MARTIKLQIDAAGKQPRDVTFHVPYVRIGSDESDADPGDWSKGKEAYAFVDDRKVDVERKIFVLDDAAWLVDQWSTNGTRLNGRWVRVAERISKGDVITMGRTSIRVSDLVLGGAAPGAGEDDARGFPERYVRITLRDKCPECGIKVALNGFRETMKCPACEQEMEFGDSYWPMVLEDPDNDYDQGEGGCTINFQTEIAWKAEPPACERCRAPLPVHDVRPGTEADIACPSCGHANVSYPPFDWLREVMPSVRQFYCGEKPDEDGNAGPGAGREGGADGQAPDMSRAISIKCPECHASIDLVPGTGRTMVCSYCKAASVMPDDLYRHLNPPRPAKAVPWYVRFQGPSGNQKEAIQEVAEDFEEIRKELEAKPPRSTSSRISERLWMVGLLAGIGAPLLVGVIVAVDAIVPDWKPKSLVEKGGKVSGIDYGIDVPEGFLLEEDGEIDVWRDPGDGGDPTFTVEVRALDGDMPASIPDAGSLAIADGRHGGFSSTGGHRTESGSVVVLLARPGRDGVAAIVFRKAQAAPGKAAVLVCEARMQETPDDEGDVEALENVEKAAPYLERICLTLR